MRRPPRLRTTSRLLSALLALLAGWSASPAVLAADQAGQAPPAARPGGEWMELPSDGSPWRHAATKLQFPQKLGAFELRGGFRDKRTEAGVAMTYAHPTEDLKADIVIYPCPVNLKKTEDVAVVAKEELSKLVGDLLTVSRTRGYLEKQRSAVSSQEIPLWKSVGVPMISQTLDLVPMDQAAAAATPPLNQWLSLLLYQDHFIQLSVVMPSTKVKELRPKADELVTLILHCLRYPSLVPDMLSFCRLFYDRPLTKEGRQSADSLLAFSKESPVFEVVLPGEAITACLDEVNAKSPETALDLLRAFVVGSSVVTLQGGSSDESLEEGARLMLELRRLLAEEDKAVTSTFLDELAKASEAQHAAAFLKERMRMEAAKSR